MLNYARRTAVLQRFSSVCIYRYHITYVLFPLTVIGRIVFGIVWLVVQYMICTSMMGLATIWMQQCGHTCVCICASYSNKSARGNMLNILLNLCLMIFPVAVVISEILLVKMRTLNDNWFCIRDFVFLEPKRDNDMGWPSELYTLYYSYIITNRENTSRNLALRLKDFSAGAYYMIPPLMRVIELQFQL